MGVRQRRTSVKDRPAFTVRLEAKDKKRLEDAAWKLRVTMQLLIEKFIVAGLARTEAELNGDGVNDNAANEI